MAPIGQIYGYVGHPKVNRVSIRNYFDSSP